MRRTRYSLVQVGPGRRCSAFGVFAYLDEQLEKFRETFVREARWIVG